MNDRAAHARFLLSLGIVRHKVARRLGITERELNRLLTEGSTTSAEPHPPRIPCPREAP